MTHTRKKKWKVILTTQFGGKITEEFANKKEAELYMNNMYLRSGARIRAELVKK